MKKKILYAIGCAAGGACVGLFANKLSTLWGAVMFSVGVALITFCTYAISKDKKDN